MDVGARREGTSLFAATSGRELLAAFFQHVPPEDTLAVDLDEFRLGHIDRRPPAPVSERWYIRN
jgi:hypothetical protein